MKTTVHHYIKKTKKGKPFPVRQHKRKVYIPPAWTHVKRFETGPIVATGIDKKGRKQYVYDPKFVEKQSKKKFSRVKKLESKIPGIMSKVVKDAEKGNQEAQAVYTMYKTGFRPGTEKDTKGDVQAYGTINLERKHVKVKNDSVSFNFVAKKGVQVKKEVRDKKLAEFMKERLADNKLFNTSEYKLRDYFDKKTQGSFHLKDLRTLKANVVAEKAAKAPGTPQEVKKAVAEAVSQELVNTPTVAIKSYVAPEVLE